MGRGAGTQTSQAPLSRSEARDQASRARAREELATIFPDHSAPLALNEVEFSIVDHFGDEGKELFNQTADVERFGNGGWRINNQPIRPYTNLYSYLPNMSNHKGLWIESSLRLDHKSGHIFAISEIQNRAKGGIMGRGFASAYKVVDCGTDLDKAIETGQELYDSAWSQFRSSDKGKKAKYSPSRWEKSDLADPLQPRSFKDKTFEVDKGIIAQSLRNGLEQKMRYDAHIGQQAEAGEQLRGTAAALGYDLNIASLKPRASLAG